MRQALQRLFRRLVFPAFIEAPETLNDSAAVASYRALTPRRKDWIAAGVLLLLLNAIFFPFLWGKKSLLSSSSGAPSIFPTGATYGILPRTQRMIDPGSPAWQLEPSLALTHREYLVERNAPLWDPYRAFGTPFAATMQPQPFYPLTILASLHPGPRTFDIFLILRLFVAGLFAYLFLRLFLSFFPSLAGAITLMLSGYFMLYLNISHLSVEVLVGAVFYAVERLLRKPGLPSILLVACIFFLTIVGGMPESAFLLWCYGYAYALLRVLTAAELRKGWLKRGTALVSATALGLSWAALLIIPFLELMSRSFDLHQFHNAGAYSGLQYIDLQGSGYALLRALVMCLAPLLQGPPYQNIFSNFIGFSGIRTYFGTVSSTLAVLAIIVSIRDAIRRRFNSTTWLALFFFTTSVLFWMKKYGFVGVNWIGRLPLFSLVLYSKYLETLQAMAMACLAAIGCSYLLERRLPAKWIVLPVGTVLLGLALVLFDAFPQLKQPATVNSYFFYVSALSVVGLLLLLMVAVFLFREKDEVYPAATGGQTLKRAALGWIILLLVAGELSLNFLVPVLYVLNKPVRARPSPYDGAPYISFLQANAGTKWRIFGRDLYLFPNWTEAFGLFDVRSLDAMYYEKYIHFVRFFLQAAEAPGTADLRDRFIGTANYDFGSEQEDRFFQLASVRYVISGSYMVDPNSMIGQIWTQNAAKLHGTPNLAIRDFTIHGETKPTLQEHPPFTRLPLRLVVPRGNSVLQFAIGIDSAVYVHPNMGGGVRFIIEARDSRGRIRKLFSRFIDPKHNPAERKWFYEEVSLREYGGQTIDLLFSTESGKDNRYDWSGWTDMRIQGLAKPDRFRIEKVYENKAKIYQLDPVLPRTAVFHHVEIANDDAAALSQLANPAFNIFDTAVVSASTLAPSDRALLSEIHNSPEDRGQAAITHYDSQHVEVSATLDRPGLLLLNDTEYPGWKAYVDGKAAHIVTANYLFRGVFLPSGRHQVDFRYQPHSFRLGLLVSCFSLIGTGIVVARAHIRNSR